MINFKACNVKKKPCLFFKNGKEFEITTVTKVSVWNCFIQISIINSRRKETHYESSIYCQHSCNRWNDFIYRHTTIWK